MKLGRRIAVGRTATVHEFGSDSVVKVPLPTTPDEWIDSEARVTESIRLAGGPAPSVRGTVRVEGRTGFVTERIRGRTLWQHIVDEPGETRRWATELANLHAQVFEVDPPADVPRFAERTSARLESAAALSAAERAEARDRVAALPVGERLLHGDLHPANVVIGADGPVVVDWFDATIGTPAADVVRSWIMMRPSATNERLPHLVDGRAEILGPLRRWYVEAMSGHIEDLSSQRESWRPVVAASRLAEGVPYQTDELLEMWRERAEVSLGNEPASAETQKDQHT